MSMSERNLLISEEFHNHIKELKGQLINSSNLAYNLDVEDNLLLSLDYHRTCVALIRKIQKIEEKMQPTLTYIPYQDEILG